MAFKSEPIETTELCEYGCGQIAKFKNRKKLMCSSYHSSCPANKEKNSTAGRSSEGKKRSRSKPIETTELCEYGCGQVAKYLNGSKRKMCSEYSNSCPEVKKRNSESLAKAYKDGVRRPATEIYNDLAEETKEKMNWNKGNRYADFSYGGKGRHKSALIQERGYKCECCGLSEWMGKPIPIELEHTDGDRANNTKENLKLLCLNCHGQTPTWKQGNLKGWKTRKYPDEVYIEVIKNSRTAGEALKKLNLRSGAASTLINIMIKYKIMFLDK